MAGSIRLYWWRPFASSRDLAISVVKYGRAWSRLALANGGRAENFGDEVSAIILRELTGLDCRRASIGGADIVGVGSALNTAIRAGFTGTVFGSGLRKRSTAEEGEHFEARVIGVRGRLTAECLGLGEDKVVGDPGLLVSDIYAPQNSVTRRPKVLIPHFEVFNSRNGVRALRAFQAEGWGIVSPGLPPREVARQISGAAFVGSSSLHGVVFAHSYGVPAQLVEFVDGTHEPGFKFNDYLSVFGLRAEPRKVDDLILRPASELIDGVAHVTATVSSKLDEIKANLVAKAAAIR